MKKGRQNINVHWQTGRILYFYSFTSSVQFSSVQFIKVPEFPMYHSPG